MILLNIGSLELEVARRVYKFNQLSLQIHRLLNIVSRRYTSIVLKFSPAFLIMKTLRNYRVYHNIPRLEFYVVQGEMEQVNLDPDQNKRSLTT